MGNYESFTTNNYVTIYSMSNSSYQDWQGELLDKTFRHVGMPGKLYRLVSDDLEYPNKSFATSNISTVIKMPSFAKLPNRVYTAMNKPGSLIELFKRVNIPDSTIMIFLDPDMIFTKKWIPNPEKNTVVGQKWKGYSNAFCANTQILENCPMDDNEAIMYPFAMRAADAKKIAQDYYNFSSVFSDDWMVEMSALVAAFKKNKLKIVTNDAIGLCNDWDNNNDPNAPIMHYCQCVKDSNSSELWCKRRHIKGTDVPNPSVATNRVDYEVLKALHYFR